MAEARSSSDSGPRQSSSSSERSTSSGPLARAAVARELGDEPQSYVVNVDSWGTNPELTRGTVVVDDGSCPYDIPHAVETGVLVPLEEPAPPAPSERE